MEVLITLNVNSSVGKWELQDDLDDIVTLTGTQITIVEGKANKVLKGTLQHVTIEGETMEINQKKIGAVMRAVRKKKKIKAAEMQDVCSTAYLSQIENGHTLPSLNKLVLWCNHMQVKPHVLIKMLEDLGVFNADPS